MGCEESVEVEVEIEVEGVLEGDEWPRCRLGQR